MVTSKNLTEQNTGDLLTLFQEAFHANPLVRQAKGKANQMTVISGLKCLELSEKLNRPLSLAKMLVPCLQWKMAGYLTKYALTWKIRATQQSNLLFQLVPLERFTQENDCGLLPTPLAKDYKMFAVSFQKRINYLKTHQLDLMTILSLNGLSKEKCLKTYENIMGYPDGWTELKD